MYKHVEKWINDTDHDLSREEKKLIEALDSLKQELNIVELEQCHLQYLLESINSKEYSTYSESEAMLREDELPMQITSNNPIPCCSKNNDVDDSEQINLQSIDLDITDNACKQHESDEFESDAEEFIIG